jgi:hypothetical protein
VLRKEATEVVLHIGELGASGEEKMRREGVPVPSHADLLRGSEVVSVLVRGAETVRECGVRFFPELEIAFERVREGQRDQKRGGLTAIVAMRGGNA